MGDNRLVTTTEPRTFHFNLPIDVHIHLKHEIYSIIKHDELLAKHIIKSEVWQLLSKYKHGNEHKKQINHTNLLLTLDLKIRL